MQRWGFFSRKARDRAKKEIFRHISRWVSFTSSSRSKNRMRDFSKADVLRPSFACDTGNTTDFFIFLQQFKMKQYVDWWREREQKKFRFPAAEHLEKAVGALTLHTGVGTYIISADRHKKCQRQSWRTSSPVSNGSRCKDGGFFWNEQGIIQKSIGFCPMLKNTG